MTAFLAALVLALSPATLPAAAAHELGAALAWHYQGQPKVARPMPGLPPKVVRPGPGPVRPHRVPGWRWSS